MEITKLEHSGIVIEKDGKRIVFDPVEFVERIPKLENVVAVVATHKHNDHLQPEVIAKILDDNPGARIFTVADASSLLGDAVVVKSGDIQEIGGFKLEFFGKDHSAIVPGQIPCENIGVIVDGNIVNPGDSFDLPNVGIEVLLVPVAAPWLKTAESMDFVGRARPKMVVPVHDAFLSDLGKKVNSSWMKMACDNEGAEYIELKTGESLRLEGDEI